MADVRHAHSLFARLVRDVYNELGRQAPEFIFEPSVPLSFDLVVDGVEFVVTYNPLQSREHIYIFCHFGSIPEHIETPALYRLLEINLLTALARATVLGIDPTSQEVVYHFNGLLKNVTAKSLLDSLVLAAQQAKRWQADYFMEDREVPMDKAAIAAPWTA